MSNTNTNAATEISRLGNDGYAGHAKVVEQQRLETLPGAQAFGGARGRVTADQDGGLVVDVDGVSRGVAQHHADAHAFTSARRRHDSRLCDAAGVVHCAHYIGREGL
jgi:hypothetical protein